MRALFVPEEQRETVLAVYALVVELEKIPAEVSEEMIGHIKYAWWQEALEGVVAGQGGRGHPVLEALAPKVAAGEVPASLLASLVEAYRSNYPEALPDSDVLLTTLTLPLISKPETWKKAHRMIATHRKRHGRKQQMWLTFKLLFV